MAIQDEGLREITQVRFQPTLLARVDAVAERTSRTRAQVIRALVLHSLPEAEAGKVQFNGGCT